MQPKKSTINKINIVFSLIIAFVSWVYVVYNFVPMKDVEFLDIPITIVGEENLEYQGLEVQGYQNDQLDVMLSVRRTDFTKITAKDIEAKVDVSTAVKGDNGLSIEIITPDGTLLEEASTKHIDVKVREMSDKER